MRNPFLTRATLLFDNQQLPSDSSTPSPTSVVLAIVIGAPVLFKALELLGYPVWLWLHQLARMAQQALFSRDPAPWSFDGVAADPDAESGDDKPNTETQASAGNVVRTLFGMSSGSLLKRSVTGLAGALSKTYSDAPPGLGNLNNSCYQNSVIQGLASLPALHEYLSQTTSELDSESTNSALFEMINHLNDPENHGRHFWIHGALKSMSTFQQQDAQEYYSKILDELDTEVHKASNRKRQSSASWLSAAKGLSDLPVASPGDETSEIKLQSDGDDTTRTTLEQPRITPNPLDGLLAQRVGCTNCGYSEGLSLIPFNCLTVPLGRSDYYDVRDCLDEYTNLEYIEGVECAKCTLLKMKGTLAGLASVPKFGAQLEVVQEALDEEDFEDKTLIKKCNVAKKNWVQSTKSRQAVVARAPKSLVLHINRSIFDETTGAQYKNNARVLYPSVLDLGHWCLGSQPSLSHLPDSAEEWPRDPNVSMLGSPPEDPEAIADTPFRYALRAVIAHSGTHGYGHYVCYRQHQQGKNEARPRGEVDEASQEQWWRFSDETVYTVPEEQALHQSGVFMLFYERLDATPSPSPSSAEPVEVVFGTTANDVLLPPAESNPDALVIDDAALQVPLPVDDLDLEPSNATVAPSASSLDSEETQPARSFARAESTSAGEDTEMSEAGSEDAPSTLLTSEDEAEIGTSPDTRVHKHLASTLQSRPSLGPHTMRTAGDSQVARGQDSPQSLPMVTAT
ncbi:hypothetical protein BDV95DRAFT_567873 [Massariosphaeria phaeospora]|uniref:ubiquitinyl hydrolase 1 n=1 Tax=Massariosphaeria phaeospora TaxID=100035 RepID=A0A7C8I998_9PLEO|nr:hypothetical protein BDV95DRAFT_567873 [Massariosphaeria phaeospora]